MAEKESITLNAEIVHKLYCHLSSVNMMLVGIHDLAAREEDGGPMSICVGSMAKLCARKVDIVARAITNNPCFGNFEDEFADLAANGVQHG